MTFRIAVVGSDGASALETIKAAGLPIYCASADGTSAHKLRRAVGGARADGALGSDGSFALVLGNEGAGVRDEIRVAADETVAVEMQGGAESLNVGIAGSILMHELTRTDT
jgi:tRNA G18 (ribose-2'-O)-methylase SpoU